MLRCKRPSSGHHYDGLMMVCEERMKVSRSITAINA